MFVLLKLTCLVTIFNCKLRVFKNSLKIDCFGLFSQLLKLSWDGVVYFSPNLQSSKIKMDNFECFESLIEGYTRSNVWTDFLFILLPILQKLPSHEHFRVFVCELLVFVGMIIKVEFLMLHHRERRWQMNFCFCWVAHTISFNNFSHEKKQTFTLLFFVL